jgi:hypothetical protein
VAADKGGSKNLGKEFLRWGLGTESRTDVLMMLEDVNQVKNHRLLLLVNDMETSQEKTPLVNLFQLLLV